MEAREATAGRARLSARRRVIADFHAVLPDLERVFGPDHPKTLMAVGNAANAYQGAGNLVRSASLNRRAVKGFERSLGPDHPTALQSRRNLAGVYETAGNHGRALPLFAALLADRERLHGRDAVATILARRELAAAHYHARDRQLALSRPPADSGAATRAHASASMVFGELYRNGGGWKFRTLGQGYASGLERPRAGLRRRRLSRPHSWVERPVGGGRGRDRGRWATAAVREPTPVPAR
ncbi:tetratricopeptide repeat protein [Streptomyces sp. KHY 26]|uniref:tetratricopeptide repeat protein n=1 Tax=Streptomyces sp. KHY 26 TaxID=3097359 RepID=UPI00376EB544